MEYETRTIEEMIAELSPPMQLQVRDFVEFLLNKQRQERREKRGKLRQDRTSKPKVVNIPNLEGAVFLGLEKEKQKKLRQDWANAIDYQTHTSVELQHLAQNWREQ